MAAAHELLLLIKFLLPLHHLLLKRTGSISRIVGERRSLRHLLALVDLWEASVHVDFTAELIGLLHVRIVSLIKEDTSILGVHLLAWVGLHHLHLVLLLLHELLLAELGLHLPCLVFRQE